MSKERTNTYPIPDRWSYLWLAIGTLLSLVSTGRWPIPLAAWLAPVFVVRFVRTQKVFRGIFLAWLATYLTTVISWWGMVSLPTPMSLIMLAIGTLTVTVPSLLADRLLAPRLKGFAATLVYPLVLTATDFLGAASSPIGSFGAWAYSQYGNLAFMQLLSLTGMWGMTFLAGWFASVVNWAWERSFDWPAVRHYLMGSGLSGDVGLMIAGELVDGTPFEGIDVIRVIDEGK